MGGDVRRRPNRLARRVERTLDGEQDEPPLRGGTAQVLQRHAPLEKVVQQGDALGALARIVQVVKQPLRLEVDRHECSVAAGWPHPPAAVTEDVARAWPVVVRAAPLGDLGTK